MKVRLLINQVRGWEETPASRDLDLSTPFTIGRREGADLVVDHPTLSPRHARLWAEGDEIWIEDLLSDNSVWILEAGSEPYRVKGRGEVPKNARVLCGALDFSLTEVDA